MDIVEENGAETLQGHLIILLTIKYYNNGSSGTMFTRSLSVVMHVGLALLVIS